jgi:hypothetical protein
VPAQRAPERDTSTGVSTPVALWQRVRADPWYAPELLALAAVRRLGPEVAGEAQWLRATYPGATESAVAGYLQRRLVRRAGYAGALAAAGRLAGPAAAVATVAWSRSRLILGTAAAFGVDATHPDRAAELLMLLGVQPTLEDARAAVAAARSGPEGRDSDPAATLWRLAGLTGAGRLAVLPGRLLRGADVVIAALLSSAEAERTARRATAFYRN